MPLIDHIDPAALAEAQAAEQQTAAPTAEGQAEQPSQPQEQQPAGESQPKANQEETPDEPKQAEQPRDDKGRFKGVQGRIDELTRAKYEAEREAAYWRGRAGVNTDPAQAPPPPAAQAAAPKPTPDQFDDYGSYIEALTDWKASDQVRKALSERDQAEQQRQQAQQQDQRAKTWAERQESTRKAMPDYDEVLASADTPVAPHLVDLLLDSDHGPAIAYHLAKHPNEAQRLNGLSPLGAARELGRLEASLSTKAASAQAAPVKPISQAPAPVRPISASASSGSTKSPSDMSQSEYEAWRKTQGAWWARK